MTPPPAPPKPEKIPYKKMKGRHRGLVVISTMFKGPDHYLFVESPFRVAERYKRFYFNEITGLQIVRTPGRLFGNIFFLLLLGLFAVLWMQADYENIYFWGVLLSLPLVFALINTLKGPMCRTFLYTVYRRHRLNQFFRVRQAVKFRRELMETVEALQGVEFSQNPAEVTSFYESPILPGDTGEANAFPRRATRALLILGMVFCLAGIVDLVWLTVPMEALLYAKAVALFGSFILSVVGLIRQSVLGAVKVVIQWFAFSLCFSILSMGAVYILSIPVWFVHAVDSDPYQYVEMVRDLVAKGSEQPMPFFIFTCVTGFTHLILGFFGLRFFSRFQQVRVV